MEAVEVPPYFLCPISLQTMRDPVIVSTGITYDRDSIERWLFSGDRRTCPITRQPLPDLDLTPNHTLRRLIQSWCVANASSGVERLPTPRPPVGKSQIADLLRQAKAKSSDSQLIALRKLRANVAESDRNKRCVEELGGIDLLLYVVKETTSSLSLSHQEQEEICEEALGILSSLQISEQRENFDDFVGLLTKLLARSNYYKSRVYAVLVLSNLVSVMSTARLSSSTSAALIVEVVSLIRDGVSSQATKAALQILAEICRQGRNRVKAVEAGAVAVAVELLLDSPEKRRVCEMVLVVLDNLCRCAEGRAELVRHPAGMAAVSKRVLRVSLAASERAVMVLHSVATFSATAAVLQEMAQVGVVEKMLVVMQVDCGMRMKEKVVEILRLHSRVWRNSPCLASQLKLFYPRS